MPALSLLLSLFACTSPTVEVPLGTWLAADTAVGVDLSAATGTAPLAARIRAVNEFGASLSSGPLTITVDGAEVQQSFDAWGYGELVVQDPHTAWVSAGGAAVPLTAIQGRWEGLGLMAASPSPATALDVQPATAGQVVVTAHDAWWSSSDGETYRVLALGERTIGGVRTADVNGDPFLDAVVWADDLVLLLQGRPEGGLAWAGGLQAEGHIARGVVADYLTDDDLIDLAVAWETPDGGGALQVWEGDGLFGFDDWPLVPTIEVPNGLCVGDNFGDGTLQLTTLLEQSENWQRFALIGREILGTGPTLPDVGYLPGSDVFSAGDLNADGGDELFLFGPMRDGIDREVRIYDFVGANVQYVPVAYTGAELVLADGNLDGSVDLFALEPRADGPSKLMELSWSGTDYAQRKVADLDGFGPMAFGDVGEAGNRDLLVAGATWQWWTGSLAIMDSGDWWGASEPTWGSWDQGLSGPIAQTTPEDPSLSVSFVGMVFEAGQTVLKRWHINPAQEPTLQQDVAVVLDTAPTPGVDVAVCGSVAWALTETQLHRVDLADGSVSSVDVVGSAIACGVGPNNAVAAVLSADELRWLLDDLSTAATEPAVGAVDLAIGLTDGLPAAHTCATEGCSVATWPVGDALYFATSEDGITTVLTDTGPRQLEGPGGTLAVWDANADGTQDLVSVSGVGATTVGLFFASPDGFGAGHFVHTRQALTGPAIVGDATADGLTDLLIADPAGKLYQSLGLPVAR